MPDDALQFDRSEIHAARPPAPTRIASAPTSSTHDDGPGTPAEPQDQILRRLFRDCQRQPDALMASLELATWQLMSLNGVLHTAVEGFVRAAEGNPASLAQLHSHLEMLFKLNRQIERYAQLQVKAAPHGPAAGSRHGRGAPESLDPIQPFCESDKFNDVGSGVGSSFFPPPPAVPPAQPAGPTGTE